MSTKLEPLKAFVVIEQTEIEPLASGLILTDDTRERMKPQEGVVLAVGPEVETVGLGDIVVYSKYAGHVMNEDNKEIRIVGIDDLYAVRR